VYIGSSRKKISAYPSAGKLVGFKALGTAQIFSRRTSSTDRNLPREI